METSELIAALRDERQFLSAEVLSAAADEIERLQRELAAAERSLSTARGEVWAEAADRLSTVRANLQAQAHRGRLNQIDEHTASVADKIAAEFRARAEKEQGK